MAFIYVTNSEAATESFYMFHLKAKSSREGQLTSFVSHSTISPNASHLKSLGALSHFKQLRPLKQQIITSDFKKSHSYVLLLQD